MAESLRQDTHLLDYWRVIAFRKEVVLSVFLLTVTLGVLATFLWFPKVYLASVKIQVREDAASTFELVTREPYRFDPLFLRTQFEIIQSRPIIEEAVRRLELDEKLGRAYGYLAALGKDKAFDRTVKLIRRRMKVHQFRDTNLIEIEIRIPELGGTPEEAPVLAARTADAIAEAYCARSVQRNREIALRTVEALGEALGKRRAEVAAAEKKVEDIRLKYKLDVLQRQRSGEYWALPKQSLLELETRRILANKELIGKKARYEELSKLSGDKLLASVMHLVNDRTLSELVVARQRAEVQVASQTKEKGPQHPDMARLNAEIARLNALIQETVTGIMTGLKIECDAAQAEYDRLTQELDHQKASERQAEASAYLEFDKAVEEMEHARKLRDAVEMRYEEEKVKLNIPRSNFDKVEPAKVPDVNDYDSPRPFLNIVLSMLFGLASGIGLAFFLEYLDTSVKTIDEIERHIGVLVVGVIPQKVRPFLHREAYELHAEAYRALRTNLQLSRKFQGGKILGFTSGSTGEGKSLTAFNFAMVCAHLGDRVLLVDADMHRPSQHRLAKVPNTVGLANVLSGEVEVEKAIVPLLDGKLHLLPSGHAVASVHALLESHHLGELLQTLKDRYDLIAFDMPPVMGVSDTLLLVREMDGTLLVIQHRKYPRAVSMRARYVIENVGGNLVGVVLNNIHVLRDYSYYGYGYYSYYAYSDASKRRKTAATQPVTHN